MKNMEMRKECGTNLNAVNLSDVEPGMCNDCCYLAIDFILHHNNGD